VNLDTFYGDVPIPLWKQIIGDELHYHLGYFLGQEGLAAGLERTVRNFYPHIPEGATVLDAGCGWGGPARMLIDERGCAVHGLTLSSAQASYCAGRGLTVDRCDLEDLVLTDDYDVAFLLESLEHVRDKDRLLRGLRAHATCLVLSTACVADTYAGLRVDFDGSILFCSVSELGRALEAAGWQVAVFTDRRPRAAPTFFHWKERLDRVFGGSEPPGHLAVLRAHTEAALRSLPAWSRSFPLIDVVAY
jgi:hypothetical protein